MKNPAKENINQQFSAQKARLNPEQRLAVETLEGPVIVLAGPGTGKTQILALRIAEILNRTDTNARSILALTFTESGVTAMRERLVSLIGPAAYGVGIYTFHGFANRVINESGAEFYKSHTLEAIDDISQLQLIISLIDRLQNEYIRRPRAPYFYVKPIISAIKQLKNEGILPSQLKELCQNEILSIANNKESTASRGVNQGSLKQKARDTIEKLRQTEAVADLYALYEEELSLRGQYDYEDMILFIIQRFNENPDLKARYQEQFHYFLVDEYQDTNNAQNSLLHLLSDYFDTPNLFVVGDDKQSIYRFQGASQTNLLNFLESYPKAKVVTLKENYRSGQPILNNAQSLIARNSGQLTSVQPRFSSELRAQRDIGEISFTLFQSPEEETQAAMGEIQELIANGANPSDIAIIYRENREGEDFAHLLNRLGIPFHVETSNDVLKDGDIQAFINLLHLASDPLNEQAFFRYIHSPYSGVETGDLIKISRLRRDERTTWVKLANEQNPDLVSLSSWEAVRDAFEKVQSWYRYQMNHNLGDTAEHIFLTSGLLSAVMQQRDNQARLKRLRRFFNEVKRVASTVPHATLDTLFSQLDMRSQYNLPLVGLPTSETGQALRLMTAHKSKGLEFRYVFIPHCIEPIWGRGKKRELLTLPQGIVPHHQVNEEDSLEEERRLFYVALTRAEEKVFLSASATDSEHKKQLTSQFISELTMVVRREASEHSASIAPETYFTPVQTRFLAAMEEEELRVRILKQPITPTGLNTFLNCPQEYLYRDIYCIPGVREAFQSFGTAIHKAMELWGNWSKDSTLSYDLTRVLSVFTQALKREGLTDEELQRYQSLGIGVLSSYWEKFRDSWVPPLATEYSFTPHQVMLNGSVPITGKLDKIEPIAKSKFVKVIDFKTGRVKSRNEIEGKTASSDGDYKRQLVFYTILAESDPSFPFTVREAAITFLDDDKRFTTEVFEITKLEKENMKELISHIYSEINQLHFDHTQHKVRWGRGESLCDILRGDMSLEFDPMKRKVIQEALGI